MAETSVMRIEGSPSSSTVVSSVISSTTTNQTTTTTITTSSTQPIARGTFAACIRCGKTGVSAAFYGRGKQYCSSNCVKGISPSINKNLQSQQKNLTSSPINHTAPLSSKASFVKLSQQSSQSINNNQQAVLSATTSKPSNKANLTDKSNQINSQSQTNNSAKLTIKLETSEYDNVNNGTNHTNTSSKEMKYKGKLNGKSSTMSTSSNATVNNNFESPSSVAPAIAMNTVSSTSTSRFKNSNSFDWCTYLNQDPDFKAAPVSSFKHVPASELWEQLVSTNLKVEHRNRDACVPSDVKSVNDVYWIASVIQVEGYYLRLRWQGYEQDGSADFWVNIYSQMIHSVGWSATQRKHLIPPKAIQDRQDDWKNYLTKNLIGANTLPNNFNEQIKECLKSNFRVGMKLEVVDKARISSVRPATISKIIGGRLHVIYDGLEGKDNGFMCHSKSNLIHPVGWAMLVGHELRAPSEYATNSAIKARNGKWSDNDADFTYFPHLTKQMSNEKSEQESKGKFVKGMKLEAVDPLNLSTICCATVTKVLRYNYIMVGIDGMMAKDGSDWFCYHASSSNIFPVGTCGINKLPLTPPKDYQKPFNWLNYLKECKATAAPVSLFNNEQPIHNFRKGMYLEAVDLMEPRLICVAMIEEVVGRLLKIHFNGWNSSFDQWVDCESVELFPIGWCEIVGYPLEPPRDQEQDSTSAGLVTSNSFVFDNTIKKRGKQAYKGGRSKKRKRNNLSTSDKFNGMNAKDDEIMDTTDDQDNCTIFNSTVEALDSTADNDETEKANQSHKSNNSINDLTRNSTVTFKPSPLLTGLHKSISNQPTVPLSQWSVQDVVNYFEKSGSNHSESFAKYNIDGDKLMRLTRDDILRLTDHKLGPSLKLYALVQTLVNEFKETS